VSSKSTLAAITVSFVVAFAATQVAARAGRPQGRLSIPDEAKLKAMTAQHRKVRSRLSAADRDVLGQLTASIRKELFARLPQTNLFGATNAIVRKRMPALTSEEATTITEYVLGGIASNDPVGAAAGGSGQEDLPDANKNMQETQMSFNLQYFQLQNLMQNENRQFTMVSNIMKTKHDTVKNSISNIR